MGLREGGEGGWRGRVQRVWVVWWGTSERRAESGCASPRPHIGHSILKQHFEVVNVAAPLPPHQRSQLGRFRAE